MRIYYSIGLLHQLFEDEEQCTTYLKEVYRQCLKHLPEHDSETNQVRNYLQGMNANLEESPQPLRLAQGEKEEDSLVQLGDD